MSKKCLKIDMINKVDKQVKICYFEQNRVTREVLLKTKKFKQEKKKDLACGHLTFL